MSRFLVHSDRRHRLRSASAHQDADRITGRSSLERLEDEAGATRGSQRGVDPRGRRSLTGLEFRRNRSI
jgi:hypothetical protein